MRPVRAIAQALATALLSTCMMAPGDAGLTVGKGAADCRVDVTPLDLPQPSYPIAEAHEGYEDTCEMRFDIDYAGRPFNLDTRCTYAVFRDSAEAAVSRVRFDPGLAQKLSPGNQCAAYLIAYRLE